MAPGRPGVRLLRGERWGPFVGGQGGFGPHVPGLQGPRRSGPTGSREAEYRDSHLEAPDFLILATS